MIIDGLIGIRFLLSGKINHTFAIIRAHLSYYKKISKIKRGENLLKSYYHTYSIIWTYYFKKS
jgi:hypothetical protein